MKILHFIWGVVTAVKQLSQECVYNYSDHCSGMQSRRLCDQSWQHHLFVCSFDEMWVAFERRHGFTVDSFYRKLLSRLLMPLFVRRLLGQILFLITSMLLSKSLRKLAFGSKGPETAKIVPLVTVHELKREQISHQQKKQRQLVSLQ